MRRRDFITGIASATAVGPVAAHAQQRAMPVIGLLDFFGPQPKSPSIEAFRAGLADGGFIEGTNLSIEYRSAGGNFRLLPSLAADLVGRQVVVIVAVGALGPARSAKAATSTIPILFIAGFDPVKLGLVDGLDRPGGNATGVSIYTTELLAKRLEFLRELVPRTNLIALLVNPRSPAADIETGDMEGEARESGFRLLTL